MPSDSERGRDSESLREKPERLGEPERDSETPGPSRSEPLRVKTFFEKNVSTYRMRTICDFNPFSRFIELIMYKC